MGEIIVPKIKQIAIRRDGHRVVILLDGQKVADLPWEAALETAKGMTAQARKIEEEIKAEGIIADQALLMRLGIPLGLTNNPDIKKEAFKDAQYDPKLRKYIPRAVGIPSEEAVGTPKLIQHKPKGDKDNGS